MNHHRPKMNGKAKEGIAFGEAILMLSPPNRSQIEVNLESGFGGWVDEKIRTAREAAPHLGWKKSHPQHLTVALLERNELPLPLALVGYQEVETCHNCLLQTKSLLEDHILSDAIDH